MCSLGIQNFVIAWVRVSLAKKLSAEIPSRCCCAVFKVTWQRPPHREAVRLLSETRIAVRLFWNKWKALFRILKPSPEETGLRLNGAGILGKLSQVQVCDMSSNSCRTEVSHCEPCTDLRCSLGFGHCKLSTIECRHGKLTQNRLSSLLPEPWYRDGTTEILTQAPTSDAAHAPTRPSP